jgi:hypothetical protein
LWSWRSVLAMALAKNNERLFPNLWVWVWGNE